MKRLPCFLIGGLAAIQLCIAALLGVYSLGIGLAETRMEENFARHKEDLQKASEQAKTLEAQLALKPAMLAAADDGYKNAIWAEHFSTTVFIASILFFGFGCAQLWAVANLVRKPMPNNALEPTATAP